MNALIVYAHPEPSSFTGAMMRRAVAALRESGHAVEVSDLHAMAFDAVSDRRNFRSVGNAGRYDQQAEELHAGRHGGFAPELRAEMDKLQRCDLLIFAFPLWWLGLPALLKGWVDRVLACGEFYGGGRHFGRGVMRGRRALCIVSVGGSARDYSVDGHYAPIEQVLYPVQRGIFEFLGFEALPPFVAYGPGRAGTDQRQAWLDALQQRLALLSSALSRLPLTEE
jgi:NAD(P)H dehydrogenase (quinone)